jgi:hypothetical protein
MYASAATYRVTRRKPSERASRANEIVARGLTMDAADALTRELRESAPHFLYATVTAPLAEQVELAAAALAAQSDESAPGYRLAA